MDPTQLANPKPSVDRRIYLAGPGQLAPLGERFLPHLGRDSVCEPI
jgi:hypothetical protein